MNLHKEDIINRMKIRLSELRRIIREAILEQGWPPGRWYPGTGEPVSDEEIGSMDSAGMGIEDEDQDDLEEENLMGVVKLSMKP